MATILTDGTKAIPLESLPPEAWNVVGGTTNSEINDLQSTVGWLYRCVRVRANTLAQMPWVITGRGDEPVWTSTDGQPPDSLAFLDQLTTLLYLTEASMILNAEAFWIKDRNRIRVVDVRWLTPSSMVPQWDEVLGLTGFKRMLAKGRQMILPVDDVCYFMLPNPMHETKPDVPPSHAAMSNAKVLKNVDLFAANFFERGAIKATLLTVDGAPQEAELDRLKAWWNRMFTGIAKSWSSEVVRSPVTPVVIGDGIAELSNNDLTREQRETIATTLGIPHSLVMSNAANYATAQQDSLNFYQTTVIPAGRLVTNVLNDQLLADLGYSFSFDPQQLSVFQEDETARSAAVLNLTNAGMTLEAALEILGYDLPDNIEIYQPEPEISVVGPLNQVPPPDDDEKATELERFRRWYTNPKKPNRKSADYDSEVITDADKALIVASVVEDGAADDAPFPDVTDWADYP